METKYIQVNSEYRWSIDTENNQLIVVIQKKSKHWLFGTNYNDVGLTEVFQFEENYTGRGFGCTLVGLHNGRHKHMNISIFDIKSFNLSRELDKRFRSYLESVKVNTNLQQNINSILKNA